MEGQFQRRAWAFLIVIGSVVAAAAVWTLPDDHDIAPNIAGSRATQQPKS